MEGPIADLALDLHVSLRPVSAVLVGLGVTLALASETFPDPQVRLRAETFSYLVLVISAGAWLLDKWKPLVGRWFTVIALVVIVPLALPSIFTGLRLEAGMAWRVVIAAEMVAIPTGIGALMMRAESLIRIDVIIVCLMVLSVMCFSFEKSLSYLEQRLTAKWS